MLDNTEIKELPTQMMMDVACKGPVRLHGCVESRWPGGIGGV